MPGVTRKDTDTAGGSLIGASGDVFVNGKGAVRSGDAVTGHGPGLHAEPTMVGCSGTVFVNGIGVCRAGDKATCGDLATGSEDVFAGE